MEAAPIKVYEMKESPMKQSAGSGALLMIASVSMFLYSYNFIFLLISLIGVGVLVSGRSHGSEGGSIRLFDEYMEVRDEKGGSCVSIKYDDILNFDDINRGVKILDYNVAGSKKVITLKMKSYEDSDVEDFLSFVK